MNMKKWMIVLLTVLLVILLGGGYIIWRNTANQSATVEEKHETFEEIEAKLIPVNMSCEDKGIRMTVVGALLTEKQLWIELELQDLEGGRLDRNYVYDNSDDWFAYNIGIREDSKTTMFDYPETGQCRLIKKFWYYETGDKDNLSVRLKCVQSTGKTNIPVLPLLEQYGKKYEGMPIPKSKYVSYSSNISSDEIKVFPFSNFSNISSITFSESLFFLHQHHFFNGSPLINSTYADFCCQPSLRSFL